MCTLNFLQWKKVLLQTILLLCSLGHKIKAKERDEGGKPEVWRDRHRE